MPVEQIAILPASGVKSLTTLTTLTIGHCELPLLADGRLGKMGGVDRLILLRQNWFQWPENQDCSCG